MAMVAAAAAAPVANQSELHDRERTQTSEDPRLGIAALARQQSWDGRELEWAGYRCKAGDPRSSGESLYLLKVDTFKIAVNAIWKGIEDAHNKPEVKTLQGEFNELRNEIQHLREMLQAQ